MAPRSWRPAAWVALGAALLGLAAPLHLALARAGWEARARSAIAGRLDVLDRRKDVLVSIVRSSADRVAALDEAQAALDGDRGALSRLFRELETLARGRPERPALAVLAPPSSPLAWAGRVGDLGSFRGVAQGGREVFVVVGSVSTTLVATAPIHGRDGQIHGLATAELPVLVRRNIRNAYLSDLDLLTERRGGVEVQYVDTIDEGNPPRPLPPLPSGAVGEARVLRAPDGAALATVRVSSPSPREEAQEIVSLYRRGVSALACLALLLWGLRRGTRRAPLRLAAAATAARGILLILGPPLPRATSLLLSPDVYASTLLGPLLRSPLDFLLTTLWLLLLAALVLRWVLAQPPRPPSTWRALAADVLAIPLLGGIYLWIGDTTSNSSLDLEAISLIPRSAPLLVLQLGLLGLLAFGACLLTILMALAGPLPSGRRPTLVRFGSWLVLGALAYRFWPRDLIGLPLVPTLALFLLTALLGGLRESWRPLCSAASPELRAGLGVATVALLSLLLYPSLVHFGEKNTRLQIQQQHAQVVLRQPEWREYILEASCRKIDELQVLEKTPPGPHPPLTEELAFAVWSDTDLAALGFSSAIEIQDPAGAVVSRFALNLPSLAAPQKPLPLSESWELTRERLALGSEERPVLHARKRLTYHGEVHGAIHVYVGDDFWNLPFITGRDPYSVLYRSASRGVARGRPIGLLAYDWKRAILFSSSERPPVLPQELLARLRRSSLWTTLAVDGRPHHIFLFSDAQGIYGLTYPRLGAGRFAADLVEAGSGLTLLGIAGLLGVMLVRTILQLPRLSLPSLLAVVAGRFSLRLFVAFVALAFAPALVLQVVVRGFVADRLQRESEDQALERAAVAKKAVEDFVVFQRGEAPGSRPVTDAALVWVSSLVRNDLDVFDRGRILASSKRELYASGLLPPRVPGEVFRAMALEGQPSVVRTEKIGGFSYLVVSVPVRLGAPAPGILSIPLALRQREVEAVLDDLDRAIRLASVLFLVAAAALAQSMARRISGPVRELTRATRRVALGDLAARVEPTTRDELRDLVESFNQMAGDLERQRIDLERSNRLAAWAEMARQVAHEVKNPLTPIQLSAEHLRRVFKDPGADFAATLDQCVGTILKQVQTLREIVTEFSAFARPPAAALEPQDLPGIVAEVLEPYRASLPPEVSLSLELGAAIPPVLADRRLVERAVLNLLENALQAVGERGTIVVRLDSSDARVEVQVEDSGPGIDPELRDRVFEPFFSTKTSGSGLGLALVKKIAEDHGGGVRLESRPGARTRAVLWLPVARNTAGTRG